jgi:hypothetical protein
MAVAVISATEFWGTCVTLRRSIEEEADGTSLTAGLGDLLLHRSRKRVDLATIPEIVAAIALILAVDTERALRRAAERRRPAKITIRVRADDLTEEMRTYLRDGVVDTLARRIVAIEPAELAASVAVEAA